MKVLIVDDERAIRNSLGEILTDEGYEVDTAEDGAVALEKVGKEKFDVIFCDIKMPGMDGVEVLGKFVEMGPSYTLPYKRHFSSLRQDQDPNLQTRKYTDHRPFS